MAAAKLRRSLNQDSTVSPLLGQALRTGNYQITIRFHPDTELQVLGRDAPFAHQDRNTLQRVGEATPLFEGIPEVMTEEEIALSQSTPGFQWAEPFGETDSRVELLDERGVGERALKGHRSINLGSLEERRCLKSCPVVSVQAPSLSS